MLRNNLTRNILCVDIQIQKYKHLFGTLIECSY